MHWPVMTLLAQDGAQYQQYMMAVPWVLIAVAFYFILIRPQQRKEKEHKSTLETLKKDDRIVTIGGIYGVVTNVRREVDRITIRVDEANNTKLDVTFNAIARVVTDEPAGEKTSK